MPYSMKFVGELYFGELFLIPTGLFILFAGRGDKVFNERAFLILAAGCLSTLFGYVLSDVIQNTASEQFLRGWARAIVLLTDITALAALGRNDKRNLWWLCFGFALGNLVQLIAIDHAPLDSWKITYTDPVTFVICCVAYRIGYRNTAIALAAAAAVGMMFDSRANPVILLIVAAILWSRRRDPGRPLRWLSVLKKMAIPVALTVVVVGVSLSYTSEKYGTRRASSTLGRELSFSIGIKAILQSPIIGVGSWNDNKEASKEQQDAMLKELGEARRGEIRGVGFTPHSQVLMGWYEGGIFGVGFFLVYGFYLLRSIPDIAFKRPMDALSSMYLYLCLAGMWNLLMSPFGGNHRIRIAQATTVIVLLALEKSDIRRFMTMKFNKTKNYYRDQQFQK
jgi:hypothetical protein